MVFHAHGYLPLLRSSAWFRQLDEALQLALMDAATIKRYAKNGVIFRAGDACDGLYAVVEGSVRFSAQPGDKEAILTLLAAPAWFGEIAVIEGNARSHAAIADQPSRLLHIDEAQLARLLAQHPQLYRELAKLITGRLRLAETLLQESFSQNVAVRAARQLLRMATAFGQWTDRTSLSLQVRQEQLALMVSTSRQTINQILRELVEKGAIRLAYGRIEIVDLEALRAAAGEGALAPVSLAS